MDRGRRVYVHEADMESKYELSRRKKVDRRFVYERKGMNSSFVLSRRRMDRRQAMIAMF